MAVSKMKLPIMKMAISLIGLIYLAPAAYADNIANCELLITERVEDEAANGSALISSYRPAGAFMASIYDDEEGHINEIEGHKIRAVFCERRSAIPSLNDYSILETGIPLSLSQNFDSALSDVILVQFKDGKFRSTYSGEGLSEAAQTELDDVMEAFNLLPNDLAEREAKIKAAQAKTEIEEEIVDDIDDAPLDLDVSLDETVDGEARDNSRVDIVILDDNNIEDDLLDVDVDTIEVDVDAIEVDVDAPKLDEAVELQDKGENISEDIADDITAPLIGSLIGPEKTVPTAQQAQEFETTCRLIVTNAAGEVRELPISGAGLQNNLEAATDFTFPAPAGFNLNRIKCKRDTLTPAAHDYKVARAGYPFLYFVLDEDGSGNRAAALEFMDGKYRMNLLDGDFTDQELIDAKARIMSFNDKDLGNDQDLDNDLTEESGEK